MSDLSQDTIKRVADRAFRDGAKAVLDQIATEPWAREIDLSKWRKEFVEQEPAAPPLPTVPFTVIEPYWKDGEGPSQPKVIRFALTLYEDGNWRGLGWFRDAATLQTQITGFKVLSSPEFTSGDWEKAAENAKRLRRETEERIEGFKARIAQVEANNRALLDRQAEVMVETTQAVIERFREHVRGGLRPSMAVEQTLRDFNAADEDESPTDTGMNHEAFAATYPNEVQWHYDGGFRAGVLVTLDRIQQAMPLGTFSRGQLASIASELEEERR